MQDRVPAAGEECALPEVLEVVRPEAEPLDVLDLFALALGGGVAPVVAVGVLDAAPELPDRQGGLAEGHKRVVGVLFEKILLGIASVWSEIKGFSCVLKMARALPVYTVLLVGRML